MGRKPWSSRLTVEQCVALDTRDFARAGVFGCKSGTSGTIAWRSHGSESKTVMRFWVVIDPRSGITLGFELPAPASPSEPFSALFSTFYFAVRVVSTECHFGGQRWWFLCPIPRGNAVCGARAKKLYLPPGATAFGCRRCWNLTYWSAKTHDKTIDPYLKMPADELLWLVMNGSWKSYVRVLKAATLLLNRVSRTRFGTRWERPKATP